MLLIHCWGQFMTWIKSRQLDKGPNISATEEQDSVQPRRLRRSRGKTNSKMIWLVRFAFAISFLTVWQLSSGNLIDGFLISRPSEIGLRFWEWLADGTIFYHASQTLKAAAYAFVIGAILAVVAGYVAGVSEFWAAVVEPFISALWAIPRIAFLPVLIIWVGIGLPLSVAIGAILVFFLLFYNTYFGIREVSQSLIDSVTIMGGNRRDVALGVRIPSAVVWVVAGLKISIPQAFVGVVTAEILASNRGLGYLVGRAAGQFDTTGAFAALFTLLIVGFSLDRLVTLLSARALAWKSPHGQ